MGMDSLRDVRTRYYPFMSSCIWPHPWSAQRFMENMGEVGSSLKLSQEMDTQVVLQRGEEVKLCSFSNCPGAGRQLCQQTHLCRNWAGEILESLDFCLKFSSPFHNPQVFRCEHQLLEWFCLSLHGVPNYVNDFINLKRMSISWPSTYF